MADRRALIASALLALGGHSLVLDWLARQWQSLPPMRMMAEPLYTRMITATTPPPPAPVVAKPRSAAAAPVQSAAAVAPSVPVEPTPTAVQTAPPEPTASTEPAPGLPLPAAAVAAAGPAPAALSANASTPAADPLAGWPSDTRLSYGLTGWFRGELQGNARVLWQRESDRYQVRVDIDISTFISLSMTSQGQVTSQGLRPAAYEEARRGRTRALRMGDADVTLEDGRRLARPAGLQDTASQFVNLAYRFANQLQALQTGGQVSFWMARPGAVDLWTYDVVEEVMLQTPKLGAVPAFHLKPRPIANPRGNITAEMWFAPGLQYLPVRIRINQGSDVHLDLLVEKIEQR